MSTATTAPPHAGPRTAERRRLDARTVAFAIVLLACLVVRLRFIMSPRGFIDGDEAVTGIAAHDILHGHFPVFFPGQAYMGALEQYLQAAVLWVLPDSAVTLRAPQLAINCATCLVVMRVARRMGLGEVRALVAGALFAVGPYFMIAYGSRSLGAYAATLLIGALGLLVAVDAHSSPRPLRRSALFGLLCGAGMWENPQSAYLLVPAGLWLLATWRGRWLRSAAVFAGGFAVGFAPVIVYALHSGVPAGLLGLDVGGAAAPPLTQRWNVFYDPILPQFLGLKLEPNGLPVTSWFPAGPLTLAAAGAAVGAAWTYRGDLLRVVALNGDRRPFALAVACLLAAPVLYVASQRAAWPAQPRYLFGLYPVLPIALAALVPRRPARAAVVATALVGGTLALTLADHRIQPPLGPSASQARGAIRVLVASGDTAVWGDYWQLNPIAFFAGDRLDMSAYSPQRFPARARRVAASTHPAYLAGVGASADQFAQTLQAHGVTFSRADVGTIAVFTHLHPAIQAWQLGLGPKPG